MSKLYQAIHAQPDAIRQLLEDWEGVTQATEHLLRAERIFLVGTGSSFHAALVGEYLFRRAGKEAWAQRSFEFVTYPRPLKTTDAIIVLSHRGSKQYSQNALQRTEQEGLFSLAITGKQTQLPQATLTLETVEQDPSSTHSISYTGALLRLAQLALRLAQEREEGTQQLEEGLKQLPVLMENVLTREESLRQIAQEAVAQQRRIYFIGAGPNSATATEGALKVKESVYFTSEGFELEQALHGPQVAFEEQDLLIPICVQGAGQQRMNEFIQATSEIGTRMCIIGDGADTETAGLLQQREHWSHFSLLLQSSQNGLVELIEELTPLLAVLPFQLLADFLAAEQGTNADSFRLEQESYQRMGKRLRM